MPIETVKDTIAVNVLINSQSDQNSIFTIWSNDNSAMDAYFAQRSPIFFAGHSIEIKNLCLYSDIRSVATAAPFAPSQYAISKETIQNEFYSWLFKQARKEIGILVSAGGNDWSEVARISLLNMQYEKPARTQIDSYVSPNGIIGKNISVGVKVNNVGNNILQAPDWVRIVGTFEKTSYYSVVSDVSF